MYPAGTSIYSTKCLFVHCKNISSTSIHNTRDSLLYNAGTLQVHLNTVHKTALCTQQVHSMYIYTPYKKAIFCTLQAHCRNIFTQYKRQYSVDYRYTSGTYLHHTKLSLQQVHCSYNYRQNIRQSYVNFRHNAGTSIHSLLPTIGTFSHYKKRTVVFTLQVHCMDISSQYKGQSSVHYKYTASTCLHSTQYKQSVHYRYNVGTYIHRIKGILCYGAGTSLHGT